MPTKRDYYEVLGVERGADADTIKKAYRQLARRFHPDANPGDSASEEKFKEVAEAYDVLSDDQKRQVYDRFGHDRPGGPGGGAGGQGFGGGDFQDIFDVFFGGGGGRRPGSPQRGSDLRYDLRVTLQEAYKGGETTIKIPRIETCETCGGNGAAPGTRPETCENCKGSGQIRRTQQTILGVFQQNAPCDRCGGRGQTVKTPCVPCSGKGRIRQTRELKIPIPAGVDSGMQMPLYGEGEAGNFGGSPGDLYVIFDVRPDPNFERDGLDLYTEAPIAFTSAALGDDIRVKSVLGEDIPVPVPEGTQPGARFTLRGQGMPDVNGRSSRRGDLHVIFKVNIPTRLTDDERKLLRQFAELRGEKNDAHAEPKGLWERLKEAVTGHDD